MEADVEYQTLLIPPDKYSIDTSVILDIWCPPSSSLFSKDRIPELWLHIEELVKEGKIIASREVYYELEKHATEDLLEWLKKHKDMFVFNRAQVEKAELLINDFYSKYKRGYKPDIGDGADPFVVATAMVNDAVVFTQETIQAPHDPSTVNTPRIPTVCSHYGVECVSITEFIDREGFKIALI